MGKIGTRWIAADVAGLLFGLQFIFVVGDESTDAISLLQQFVPLFLVQSDWKPAEAIYADRTLLGDFEADAALVCGVARGLLLT